MNYLFPVIAALLWGVNTLVTKLASGTVGAVDISLLRWFFAAVVVSPWAIPRLRRNMAVIRPNLGRFFLLGLLGSVVYQCAAYYAAHFTSATNMGVIQSLIPLITLMLSAIFLRHRVTALVVAGALVSAFGVVMVISHGDPRQLTVQGLNRGDGLIVLGATAFALYNLLMHKWKLKVSLVESLFMQASTATIMLVPLWLAFGEGVHGAAAWGCIAFAGIGASVMAPLCWMAGISRLGAARVTGFFNLVPIVTAVLAVFALGEKLTVTTACGGLLTILGVIVAEYAGRRTSQPAKEALA
ncbi:DMT family transporter [Luteibacter anthropi]|uniref:DMT family transporter n=1 Tax=Luteibacter anthropi TaxID=564369 RepID=A0A7X5U6I4_9GAMM|nr:DMT family transporter [Luteibacter anthropi]NII04798.1 DMT family transporter [Luteibacter anthropi]URX63606.1 DMT family transporter [Luteibacter anthropi]